MTLEGLLAIPNIPPVMTDTENMAFVLTGVSLNASFSSTVHNDVARRGCEDFVKDD